MSKHGILKKIVDHKGFSLIEVVIGVAIFMVGMLGVAALLISAVNGDAFSGNLTEATALGSSKMDVLMGLPLGHVDLNDDDGDIDAGLDDACVTAIDATCVGNDQADGCDGCASAADGIGKHKIYRVFWNIAANYPEAQLTSINVIVKWKVKDDERSIAIGGIRSGVL